MNKRIIFLLLMLVSVPTLFFGAERKFTLVIDAGHGGHDCGARGSFSNEKTINLNVALAFGRYVERNCPDVRVIYTRKSDVFVPLHKRAEIANKNKADAFISIHTNALPKGHVARGIETYTMGMRRSDEKLSAAKRENSVVMIESDYKERYAGYDPNMPESTIMFEFIHDKNMAESVELAKCVQKRLCAAAGRPNKGVKQDVFLVLRETSMPACLIELGFITTPDEERMLNDKAHIDKMAQGIYNAFVDYLAKSNRGSKIPYIIEERKQEEMPSIVPQEGNDVKRVARKSPERIEKTVRTESRNSRNDVDDEQKVPADADKAEAGKTETADGKPVFKVQILASSRMLRPGSSQFKGLENVEFYKEGGLIKYTCGASENYNEINRLRKTLIDKFPQAFIIAFKNGEKVNVGQAIKEFKSKKEGK